MLDKPTLRAQALEARESVVDRPVRQRAIMDALTELPVYRQAELVATYVGVGSEVATTELIAARNASSLRTAVVYRRGPDLGLCLIDSLDELEPASFGLLEPGSSLQNDPARAVAPSDVDLFLVPGLAFDGQGGRIGYGRGYYDRLLASAGAGPAFLALAFDCQMVGQVPMGPDDVPVHLILTETGLMDVSGPPQP